MATPTAVSARGELLDRRQRLEFGEERLVQAAERRRTAPVVELVQGCLDDLAVFRNGVTRHDDLTLLALRRRA